MSQCVVRSKDKNKQIITQIGEKEYLLECYSDWARFGCQTDTSMITSAQLSNGLHLLAGDSFLGQGKISFIQNIENEQTGYMTLKIMLY